ncbi:MAG: succinate dehydrogenase [Chloroflexi bacterium]|nr:succinate dehydrogenase [Chloroflexota bacterium]
MAQQPAAVPARSAQRASGWSFELAAWLFMRLSGLALLALALGHLAIMHLIATVDAIDYAFVAERWAVPAWRVYDLLLLLLALLHGANGARVVVDDYLPGGAWRAPALTALYGGTLAFAVLGAAAILTFPVIPPEPR